MNESIGCYGAAGRSSDVIDLFGVVSFSRKTALFATMGAAVAFLIILGCCYQAVTFQGENEELPGPGPDAEAVAQALKQAEFAAAAASSHGHKSAAPMPGRSGRITTVRVQAKKKQPMHVPEPVL